LFVVVSILDDFSLFLDINAFFVILDNQSRFFDNNMKTIISIKNIETITLEIVIIVSKRFIVKKIDISCFIL